MTEDLEESQKLDSQYKEGLENDQTQVTKVVHKATKGIEHKATQ